VRTRDFHRSWFDLEDLMQVVNFLGEDIRSETNIDHDFMDWTESRLSRSRFRAWAKISSQREVDHNLPQESDRGWSKVAHRS
jgi:hypothetical protein